MSLRVSGRRVDITPQLWLAPTGFSVKHKGAAWGKRGRLYANVLLVADGAGRRVVLLGLDLHAATRCVIEAIAAKVGDLGVTADTLFAGATHTHAGPGNFYGWSYYDTFAGEAQGFNAELVEWLATRIGGAIRALVTGPQRPARVGYGTHASSRLTVNRSKAAFRENRFEDGSGDPRALLEFFGRETRNPVAAAASDDEATAVLGVDPRVHVVWFEGEDGTPAGMFASFGGHNTVSRNDHRLLHNDVFGTALFHARHELGLTGRDDVPLALVSGSSGDTLFALPPDTPEGPGWWDTVRKTLHEGVDLDDPTRWRWVEHAGRRLGDALVAAARVARADTVNQSADAGVSVVYRCTRVAGAPVGAGKLADRWMIGRQVSAGGPWEPPWSKVPQNVLDTLDPGDPQAPKVPFLAQAAAPLFEAPDELPIRLVRIGKYALVGLPGEPTSWLSNRIERRVRLSVPSAAGVLVCGYAGDYCGYLPTTPEYVAQDYEGASTLWGRATGDWVLQEVGACIRAEATPWKPRPIGAPGKMAITRRMDHSVPRGGSTLRARPRPAGRAWVLRGEWYPTARALVPLASRADPTVDVGALVRLQIEGVDGWRALTSSGVPVDDALPRFEVWLDIGPGRFGFEYALPFDPTCVGRRLRFQVVHPDYRPADPTSDPTAPLLP